MWAINVGDVGENVGARSGAGFLAALEQFFDPDRFLATVRDRCPTQFPLVQILARHVRREVNVLHQAVVLAAVVPDQIRPSGYGCGDERFLHTGRDLAVQIGEGPKVEHQPRLPQTQELRQTEERPPVLPPFRVLGQAIRAKDDRGRGALEPRCGPEDFISVCPGDTISRVDPLPHQLEAVYDHLLKAPRVRFLLADDAGAGKTIMAGLLVRELKLRGLCDRVLIVCPANLTFQWQREMKEKFDEKFLVLKGGDIREQFGVNQWLEHRQVITSLDLAKRTDILPGLRQVHWELVIVDESHRMSAADSEHKTQRYRLGELLRDTSDHFLLLTATPHRGDPENFSFFLQLLDADVFADVKSIREAMDRRRAPFYLRRTKEAMVYFPHREPDGSWVCKKIFTKRIPHTADFRIDGPEFEVYRDITRFVKRESAKAAGVGDDPRARAVGFLMSLFQRRLASSSFALQRSLEKRATRLEEKLRRAQEVTRDLPADFLRDFPTPEELEEMEDSDRERMEEQLASITLAQNPTQVREEIQELRTFAGRAQELTNSNAEAKLSKLKSLLEYQGFY
jgi:hypothetical protein